MASDKSDLFYKSLSVTLALVILGVTVSTHIDQRRERKKTDQLSVEVAELRNQTKQTTVPIIEGLDWSSFSGTTIKTLRTDINMTVDVQRVMSLGGTLEWDGSTLLPVPWPTTYVETFRQEFNPYTFAENAAVLRAWKDRVAPEAIRRTSDYLLLQLEKYTRDDAVFYDFDYEIIESGILKAGWQSAYANGMVAIGLMDLAEATDNMTLRERAKRYLDKVLWRGKNTDLSLVDSASYLWFEETPPLHGRATHVINGHIAVVFALYRYMQVTGDPAYERYVKAGLATAARYFWETRRPGKIPTYWLYNETADYGPLRAINFADTLAAITGHPIFSDLSAALRTDVPIR
ncbi:D-glucuronyl C5-epimerase family protein [Achromobacter piechaudii]|uniref:D-glucuronyl C5-epimerase family protein n=1 Tax=Achromobacter piechaudii TaxID=72556 RepID=UPI003DA9DD7E